MLLLYGEPERGVLAKIAVELRQALARRAAAGAPGQAAARPLARGEGWQVTDVLCTHGPHDRPFEERHSAVSIAIVAAGTFQYRSAAGRELMTPGSLLLGNPGQTFECGHEHASGDRCIAFSYDPDYFARLAADAGVRCAGFRHVRLPPLRDFAPSVSRACTAVSGPADITWDELATELAVRAASLASPVKPSTTPPPNAEARVTRSVRMIDRDPAASLDLATLARAAGLSAYHFLRTFHQITGLTPHQYILRARLRAAATRIAAGTERILEVALDCGFGDLTNFNRAFRMEFGTNPRAWRKSAVRR